MKFVEQGVLNGSSKVTLHARVWIEIRETLKMVDKTRGHPPREGVD